MAANSESPVTVLGLGPMGSALATTFTDNGHPTTVWNRTPEKAAPLVAKGAVRADTPAEAIEASPLVVVCLRDHDSVRAVLDPLASALSGRDLVDLTTGTPEQARELSEWADGHGAAGFVDGGIMATPSMIGGPHAFVLYSGSRAAFDRHEAELAAFGGATYVDTDPGLAALYDVALLSGMYGMIGGALHAMALAGTGGADASGFTSSLLVPWLRAMVDGMLPELARRIDAGDYAAPESTLAMQTSGAGFAEISEAAGISGALLAPLEEMMRRRVAAGHGDEDIASVIELVRKPSAGGAPSTPGDPEKTSP